MDKKLAEKALEVIASAFKADPVAVRLLLGNRVQCSYDLAEHPTVICGDGIADGEVYYTLTALGLVNGILGELAGCRIVAIIDDTQRGSDNAPALVGFKIVESPTEDT